MLVYMTCKRFFTVYINFRFCNNMTESEFVHKIQNSSLTPLVNGVYKKKNQFCVASFLSSQYWSVMYMYMLIIMTLQGDHVYNQQSIIRKSIHGLFLLIGTEQPWPIQQSHSRNIFYLHRFFKTFCIVTNVLA